MMYSHDSSRISNWHLNCLSGIRLSSLNLQHRTTGSVYDGVLSPAHSEVCYYLNFVFVVLSVLYVIFLFVAIKQLCLIRVTQPVLPKIEIPRILVLFNISSNHARDMWINWILSFTPIFSVGTTQTSLSISGSIVRNTNYHTTSQLSIGEGARLN